LLYWIALGLAGASLAATVVTLYLVWTVRQSALRAEQAGDERLESLREQQQRLEFMREERRTLEKELEWRRSTMAGGDGAPENHAPLESNGHSESESPTRRP
jgi:hypothetical protein